MKTMTIRDIRQHWPEAERQLAIEKEIIITRDGKPVAKLSSVEEPVEKMQKFDPQRQREKREEIFGKGVTVDWVKDFCEVGRAEREF